MKKYFENPVLKGFYPDPSICKVGEWFYMVTSSMEFFPGIPLFRSTDLVNWDQIGYVLTRPEQLDLDHVDQSMGLMAPTIRYHDGRYYVTCENHSDKMVELHGTTNFLVHTDDIMGEWSDAHYIEGAKGFDNALYFENGKAYYHATSAANPSKYLGDNVIWMQEFDYVNFKLIGERKEIWSGTGDVWLEGPHIYLKDGYYYLLCSEGGTFLPHSVTIARSEHLFGPYVGARHNPILTNRHVSKYNGVTNVGHAEFVETDHGEWWVAALASRPYYGKNGEEYSRNLGRETFILPMIWEDEWPIICPETGKAEIRVEAPNLPEQTFEMPEAFDDFDTESLKLCWNFVRTPRGNVYSLTERPDYLRLYLRPQVVDNNENPSILCRRMQHFDFVTQTKMTFVPQNEGEEAGLMLMHNAKAYIKLVVILEDGVRKIRVVSKDMTTATVLAEKEISSDTLTLKITQVGTTNAFYVKEKGVETMLVNQVSSSHLNSDYVHSHTGSYIGLYATSNGKESTSYVDYDWFAYDHK